MKSEKAKSFIDNDAIQMNNGDRMIDASTAYTAVELAEQEAEERMRKKAAKAYCQDCCCTIVGECRCGIGSENCEALQDFIQKLNRG